MRVYQPARHSRIGLTSSARAALCLIALAAGTLATYAAGRWYTQPPPQYLATAVVVERPQPGRDGVSNTRQDLASDARIERALASLHGEGIVVRHSPAALRSQLKVEAGVGEKGSVRTAVSLASADGQQAMALVNRLVDQYVAERRQSFERSAGADRASAHAALESARAELSRFEREQKALLREADATRAHARLAPPTGNSAESQSRENPEWTALAEQRASLEERQRTMLLTRTAAHPEVLYVNEEIAEIEQQMATVPRHVPPGPEIPRTEPSPSELERTNEEEQLAARLEAATAAISQAEAECQRTETVERQARARLEAGPGIESIPARRCQTEPAPDPPAGLLWYSLATGLVIAAAVGWASRRLPDDRPFATVAEAQSALAIPIVGVIPRETGSNL